MPLIPACMTNSKTSSWARWKSLISSSSWGWGTLILPGGRLRQTLLRLCEWNLHLHWQYCSESMEVAQKFPPAKSSAMINRLLMSFCYQSQGVSAADQWVLWRNYRTAQHIIVSLERGRQKITISTSFRLIIQCQAVDGDGRHDPTDLI